MQQLMLNQFSIKSHTCCHNSPIKVKIYAASICFRSDTSAFEIPGFTLHLLPAFISSPFATFSILNSVNTPHTAKVAMAEHVQTNQDWLKCCLPMLW